MTVAVCHEKRNNLVKEIMEEHAPNRICVHKVHLLHTISDLKDRLEEFDTKILTKIEDEVMYMRSIRHIKHCYSQLKVGMDTLNEVQEELR